MFFPFACSSACLPRFILYPLNFFGQDLLFLMDKVCKCLARRIHLQLSFNLRLNSYFPVVHMTFEENCVDPLGKVGLGGAGCVGLLREVKVRQLGPYLAVVEFFMRLRDWSGGLGWKVIVPSDNMVERRSAFLALPCRLLLCVETTARVLKEIFQLVVRRSKVCHCGRVCVPVGEVGCRGNSLPVPRARCKEAPFCWSAKG